MQARLRMAQAQMAGNFLDNHTILQNLLNFKGISLFYWFFVNYAIFLC